MERLILVLLLLKHCIPPHNSQNVIQCKSLQHNPLDFK